MKYYVFWLLPIFLMALGCDGLKRNEKYSETRAVMGTFVHLDVCRDQADLSEIKNAYTAVWKRIDDISSRMSVFDEGSDILRINHSGRDPVTVGEDTYALLAKSKELWRLTDGAFDITVGPLVDLWKTSEQKGVIPTQEAVLKTLSVVGPDNVQLLPDTRVQLLNQKTRLDLGAIAKGYAVDEAARLFRQYGITRFFIDAGGDIYVGGMNCSGEPWRIGIRDPRDATKIMDIVHLMDKAVTTSGDYEQYYEINGKTWSHIMDPTTGYPEMEVTSATVIADEAMTADALATALCVLGAERGTEHIDRLPGLYASLVVTHQASGNIQKLESKEYKKYKYKE